MIRKRVSAVMQWILVGIGVLSGLAYLADTRKSREEYMLQKETLNAAQVGRWAWDTNSTSEGSLRWDANMFHVFGADKESFGGTYEDFAKYVHPEDKDRISKLVSSTAKNGGRYAAVFRVIDTSGETRDITAIGAMLPDKKTMGGIVILHVPFETEKVLMPPPM